jgi:hypothetical protein
MRIRDGKKSHPAWKSQIWDGKKSDPGWKKVGSGMEKRRIRDGKKQIRDGKKADPGRKKGGSGMEKSPIRDREKHPESATLVLYFMYCRTFVPLSQLFLIRKLIFFQKTLFGVRSFT